MKKKEQIRKKILKIKKISLNKLWIEVLLKEMNGMSGKLQVNNCIKVNWKEHKWYVINVVIEFV